MYWRLNGVTLLILGMQRNNFVRLVAISRLVNIFHARQLEQMLLELLVVDNSLKLLDGYAQSQQLDCDWHQALAYHVNVNEAV